MWREFNKAADAMATRTIQEGRDLDEILENGMLVRVLARGRGALWGSFDGGMRGRTAAAGATLKVRIFSDQEGGSRITGTQEVGRWGRLVLSQGRPPWMQNLGA